MTTLGLITFLMLNTASVDSLEVVLESRGYSGSLGENRNAEEWGFDIYPLIETTLPIASSVLLSQGNNTYAASNVQDYDISTAWIPSSRNHGIGESLEFVFNYPDYAPIYGSVYQFDGELYLFNGYCKSEKTWRENSRVKKLKVYLNDKPVFNLELKDNWRLQVFDVKKFFKNRSIHKYPDAPYEIVKGDRLRFEIVEVYKGDKYDDVAISELLGSGGGN